MTGEALTGLIMLVVMIGVIFIGFPISFTLLFLALTFGYFSFGHTVFDLAYFQTIGMMKEELLAAVPLFVLMGAAIGKSLDSLSRLTRDQVKQERRQKFLAMGGL